MCSQDIQCPSTETHTQQTFGIPFGLQVSFLQLIVGFHISNMKSILPEANRSHLKMDGWNTNFLFVNPVFRYELLVSGRVYKTFFRRKPDKRSSKIYLQFFVFWTTSVWNRWDVFFSNPLMQKQNKQTSSPTKKKSHQKTQYPEKTTKIPNPTPHPP